MTRKIKPKRLQSPARAEKIGQRLTEEQKIKVMETIVHNAIEPLTNEQLAYLAGISEGTLIAWKKKYPKFAKDLKHAQEMADLDVVKSLKNRAIGFRIKVQKPMVISGGYENGAHVEIVEYEEYIPANVTAMTYWLNNRQPHRWSNSQKIDLSMFQSMPDDQLRQIVKEVVNDQPALEDSESVPE